VHEPVQSALHFVVQSAVVGIETQFVVQWSSQQEPHDAVQSADADAELVTVPPSSEVDEDADALHCVVHPDSQRWSQSVVQSTDGGLAVHWVVQLDWQVDVQVASADAVHCESHCCSSFAAHAASQLAGAHWVEQFCWMTS